MRGDGSSLQVIDDQQLFRLIGKRIRERRDEVGLTQAALAQLLGFERTSITNIERGNQKAPLPVLYRICAHLEIPIEELLPPIDTVLRREVGPAEDVTVGQRTEPRVPPKTAALIKKLTQMPTIRKS